MKKYTRNFCPHHHRRDQHRLQRLLLQRRPKRLKLFKPPKASQQLPSVSLQD